MNKSFHRYWPWFFFTAAFESLVATLALIMIPSENGLSAARFGLISVLLLFVLSGILLGFHARRNPDLLSPRSPASLAIPSALIALASSLALFLLRYLEPETLLPYYERLSPLLWVLLFFGVQGSIFLLLVKNGFHKDALSERIPAYRAAILFFAILLAVFIFVVLSRIGITPDTGYWGEPGVAIQGWQFGVSILLGFFVLLSGLATSARMKPHFHIIILPLLIYMIAVLLWLRVPISVLENSFYAPISPPANIPFPYSDAGFYDYLSQSLLIGTDYLGGIPPRPLYVLFLTVLHLTFGQNYPAMIVAQTSLLALFPVALYYLGKAVHSPAAGVVAASFAVFRELVGLWISSNTRVVNSKIFTTDFPTALAMVFLCLVVIWWLKRRDLGSTLVAGGAFGLLLLFRTQSLFTLPFVLAIAWFAYKRKSREWILACATLLLAVIITVSPWLVHNRLVSGKFSFDDPRQMAIIYSQYSRTGNLDLSRFDPEKDSVGERIVSFTLENPGYVANFVATHFLNTEIGGLLALPLIKSFEGLLKPANLYWVGWDGSLEWYNIALLLFYLAVLSVGLGAAWRHLGWIGLVPLGFNLGYALANGISRFSSWRYNLPVDWVIYFYFAIGTIEILAGISLMLGSKIAPTANEEDPGKFSFQDFHLRHIAILLAFSLFGALPWIAKGFAQPRYTATQMELLTALENGGYSSTEVWNFLNHPDAVLIEGRMLYPRMYRKELGMTSANPWPAYEVRDYARIGFIILNDRSNQALFITRDLLDFPQGADTILLGCRREGYIEARLVDFGDHSYLNRPLTDGCD